MSTTQYVYLLSHGSILLGVYSTLATASEALDKTIALTNSTRDDLTINQWPIWHTAKGV